MQLLSDIFCKTKRSRESPKTVNYICNNLLTNELLRIWRKSVPLHTVISFSVINYVVSMRRPRESGEVSFFLH